MNNIRNLYYNSQCQIIENTLFINNFKYQFNYQELVSFEFLNIQNHYLQDSKQNFNIQTYNNFQKIQDKGSFILQQLDFSQPGQIEIIEFKSSNHLVSENFDFQVQFNSSKTYSNNCHIEIQFQEGFNFDGIVFTCTLTLHDQTNNLPCSSDQKIIRIQQITNQFKIQKNTQYFFQIKNLKNPRSVIEQGFIQISVYNDDFLIDQIQFQNFKLQAQQLQNFDVQIDQTQVQNNSNYFINCKLIKQLQKDDSIHLIFDQNFDYNFDSISFQNTNGIIFQNFNQSTLNLKATENIDQQVLFQIFIVNLSNPNYLPTFFEIKIQIKDPDQFLISQDHLDIHQLYTPQYFQNITLTTDNKLYAYQSNYLIHIQDQSQLKLLKIQFQNIIIPELIWQNIRSIENIQLNEQTLTINLIENRDDFMFSLQKVYNPYNIENQSSLKLIFQGYTLQNLQSPTYFQESIYEFYTCSSKCDGCLERYDQCVSCKTGYNFYENICYEINTDQDRYFIIEEDEQYTIQNSQNQEIVSFEKLAENWNLFIFTFIEICFFVISIFFSLINKNHQISINGTLFFLQIPIQFVSQLMFLFFINGQNLLQFIVLQSVLFGIMIFFQILCGKYSIDTLNSCDFFVIWTSKNITKQFFNKIAIIFMDFQYLFLHLFNLNDKFINKDIDKDTIYVAYQDGQLFSIIKLLLNILQGSLLITGFFQAKTKRIQIFDLVFFQLMSLINHFIFLYELKKNIKSFKIQSNQKLDQNLEAIEEYSESNEDFTENETQSLISHNQIILDESKDIPAQRVTHFNVITEKITSNNRGIRKAKGRQSISQFFIKKYKLN